MEQFGVLMETIYSAMQKTVIIYGHEFSFWQLYMFTLVGGIICWFIGDLINGD